ncbi:MAG: Ig domain-containing protein [Candidatus Acidiferrum sp.]
MKLSHKVFRTRIEANALEAALFISLMIAATVWLAGCGGASSVSQHVSTAALQILSGSLPGGTAEKAYSETLTASGGTAPYSWSVSAGMLPAGLTLAAAIGTISGTPTTAGSFSFTAMVTDSSTPTAETATQPLSITVTAAPAPVSITTTSLANGQQGTTYSASLAATGGTTPYTWSISASSLPPGLNLNASTGAISGTPTAAGTFGFTVKVTDSTTPTAQSATQKLSIAVAAAQTPVSITTTFLPEGQQGNTYTATLLTARGGVTPYSWSVSAGALPAGLTLSSSGTLSGVPTASGSFAVTIKVKDSTTPTAETNTASFTITIVAGADHSVLLTWTASPSPAASGYNVYRSNASGTGFSKINSAPVSALTYSDGTVVDGLTYYYATTAVDSSGDENTYSEQIQIVIP